VLARQTDGGGAIRPFQRRFFHSEPSWICSPLRMMPKDRSEAAIDAEGDHAQAQRLACGAGESYVAVKIRDARSQLRLP